MLLLSSCGSNAHGQLGNGSADDAHTFQPCLVPPGTSRVVHVATGANHTLILLENRNGRRELWGCGDGRKGQLGKGNKQLTSFERIQLSLADEGLGDYTLKFVEATWETSYAVLSSEGHSDTVISFGSDDYGDLGVGGGSKDSDKDFHVVSFDHLLPFGMKEIIAISTGQRHVVVEVRSSSSLFLVGWGLSRHGQLGSPAGSPFASIPRFVTDGLPDACISCALGIHHTLVHRQSNSISGLGSDRKGQLQVVKEHHSGVQSVHCTWNGSYIVVEDQGTWEVRSSGSNSRSQLGWTPDKANIVGVVSFPDHVDRRQSSVSVVCGSEHVLALISYLDRHLELWGWGWNEHGNLGLGDTVDVPLPVKIDAVGISHILGVWAGSGTSWICSQIEADF